MGTMVVQHVSRAEAHVEMRASEAVVTQAQIGQLLSQFEAEQVLDYLEARQSGVVIGAEQSRQPLELIVQGLEHPATRADTLSRLLAPEQAPLLEEALARADGLQLGAEARAALVTIAQEGDVGVQVAQLADLIHTQLLAEAESIPAAPAPMPAGAPIAIVHQGAIPGRPEQLGESRPVAAGSNNTATADELYAIAEHGTSEELQAAMEGMTTGQLAKLLAGEGEASGPLLRRLANDPTYGAVARSLLAEGPDLLDTLLARAPAAGVAAPELPAAEAAAFLIQGDLPGGTISDQAAQIDSLIAQLSSEDFAERRRAMELLHELGPAATPQLEQAAGREELRDPALKLISWITTGESPFQTPAPAPDLPVVATRSLSELAGRGAGHGAAPAAPVSLSVDYLIQNLSRGGPQLDAMSAVLVQLGAPAVPTLCDILLGRRQ